jgi:hypothetical protein
MTRSNALSNVILADGSWANFCNVLRNERCNLKFSTSKTMRGEGDHHKTGWPSEYQGNMPWLYASSKRCTDKTTTCRYQPLQSAGFIPARSVRWRQGIAFFNPWIWCFCIDIGSKVILKDSFRRN